MAVRLLVTGFGPFPGMPDNPSEALVRALGADPPTIAGHAALRTLVLPTEYRRSWQMLANAWRRFGPDVVLHIGVNRRAERIVVETRATRRIDPALPDAAGFVPALGVSRRSGPVDRVATIDCRAVIEALAAAEIPAELSNDAGLYLCNATLYRSLARSAATATAVGFIHIPHRGPYWTPDRLTTAAEAILAALARSRATVSSGRPSA